jgi:outer membrane immunogenic protein
MPLKAPPKSFSWAGPYVGLAFGGKWGDARWTTTSTSDLPGTIVDASSPATFRPAGIRLGGLAGYNWQADPWVYGVEFDLAFADGKATHSGLPGCAIECVTGFPGPGVDSATVKLGWDASARARLGYLVQPGVLVFATGGVAWQSVETTGLCRHSAPDPQCTLAAGTPFDEQSDSEVRTGWTVGLGIETHLAGNWLFRCEYRYADFGTMHGVFDFAAAGVPAGSDTLRYDLAVRTHAATVGLAYKFGGT